MNEHPSIDIVGSRGDSLAGRHIVLCLCGSVAVARSVELARLLMRHGAQVHPVMSQAAAGLIQPDLLEWATGRPPILKLTGAIEHVSLAGNVPVHADLVLVAPATANTIGKIACGIDDGPVTTMVTTALGEGIPVVVAPAMHEAMYRHPLVQKNLRILTEEAGVTLVLPEVAEGKAKISAEEAILAEVQQRLAPPSLKGRRILVTSGRTVEFLDPVRVLSNRASGRMGAALADEARRRGAQVIVVAGEGEAVYGPGLDLRRVRTAAEMAAAVEKALAEAPVDLLLASAAPGDWRPVTASPVKLPTAGGRLVLELEPTPKIIDRVKDWSPRTKLVAFRANSFPSVEEFQTDARARLVKARADFIAANDISEADLGFGSESNRYWVAGADGRSWSLGPAKKTKLAALLLDIVEKSL